MPTNSHYCPPMPTNANQCPPMPINANQCPPMQTNAHQCKPMPTKAYRCPPMQSNANPYPPNANQFRWTLPTSFKHFLFERANHWQFLNNFSFHLKSMHTWTRIAHRSRISTTFELILVAYNFFEAFCYSVLLSRLSQITSKFSDFLSLNIYCIYGYPYTYPKPKMSTRPQTSRPLMEVKVLLIRYLHSTHYTPPYKTHTYVIFMGHKSDVWEEFVCIGGHWWTLVGIVLHWLA